MATDTTRDLTIRILEEARTLIAKGWTKKYFATDTNGYKQHYFSKAATHFCVLGSILRATTNLKVTEPPGIRAAMLGTIKDHETNFNLPNFNLLEDFNDYTSQEQVLAMMDATISRLKEEPYGIDETISRLKEEPYGIDETISQLKEKSYGIDEST